MPAHRTPQGLRILANGARDTERAPSDAEVAGTGLNFTEVPDVLDESGVTAWRHLERTFADRADRFREGDRAAVTAYCMARSLHDGAARELLTEGLKVQGRSAPDRARMVKNPAWQLWRDSSMQLRYWARELGLTPDARARAGIVDADAKGNGGSELNPFA